MSEEVSKRAPERGVTREQVLNALIGLHADTVHDVRYETAPDMQLEAAALQIAIRMVRDHFYDES